MEPEQILNRLRRAITRRVDALAISVTSGGVDTMEKYRYLVGQAHGIQLTLQDISNLLKPKEQKNDIERAENVVDFGRTEN